MPIDILNVVISSGVTGFCALHFGKSGLIGSVIGHIIYFVWIRDMLFVL
jgi:hypothetical protein